MESSGASDDVVSSLLYIKYRDHGALTSLVIVGGVVFY